MLEEEQALNKEGEHTVAMHGVDPDDDDGPSRPTINVTSPATKSMTHVKMHDGKQHDFLQDESAIYIALPASKSFLQGHAVHHAAHYEDYGLKRHHEEDYGRNMYDHPRQGGTLIAENPLDIMNVLEGATLERHMVSTNKYFEQMDYDRTN